MVTVRPAISTSTDPGSMRSSIRTRTSTVVDLSTTTAGIEVVSARARTAARTAMSRTTLRDILSAGESRETLLLHTALTTARDGMKVTCPDNKGSYRHRSGPTFASSASGKEWRMTAQRKNAAATEDAWAGQNLAQF